MVWPKSNTVCGTVGEEDDKEVWGILFRILGSSLKESREREKKMEARTLQQIT